MPRKGGEGLGERKMLEKGRRTNREGEGKTMGDLGRVVLE